MVAMGSVVPAWRCTLGSLTLMKGLNVISSPIVEGIVGWFASRLDYKITQTVSTI